jgi:hypothetical protein
MMRPARPSRGVDYTVFASVPNANVRPDDYSDTVTVNF